MSRGGRMLEREPWSLAEKIGIPGVLVGLAAGAILTAAAVLYSTSTILWNIVLWGGVTILAGSVACALLLVSSHYYSGRPFMVPSISIVIGIGLLVFRIASHFFSGQVGVKAVKEVPTENNSDASVYAECHLEPLPTHEHRVYKLDTLEGGGGGLAEQSSPNGEPLFWPENRNGISPRAYKCTLTNYSNDTLFNLSLTLTLKFSSVIDDGYRQQVVQRNCLALAQYQYRKLTKVQIMDLRFTFTTRVVNLLRCVPQYGRGRHINGAKAYRKNVIFSKSNATSYAIPPVNVSTFLDCRPKNVDVISIVIPELKFRNIQVKVLFANLMEGPDNASLQNRPEAFDGLSMDCAVNVLMGTMIYYAVRISLLRKARVLAPVVSAKQADLVRDGFIDKGSKGRAFNVLYDAGNDVALATLGADNNGLAIFLALPWPLIPMAIAAISTDHRFINLDDTGELANVLDHRSSDLVAHEPCRLVRPEPHVAKDLESAHSLFADQHEVHDSEPVFQRLVRIFKNRPGKIREAITSIAAWGTLRALPMPRASMQLINGCVATAGAKDSLRPTASDQIRLAVVFRLKQRVELRCGHLVDWLRLLLTGHDNHPRLIGRRSHV
jgi:hypothetical protein